MTKKKLFRSGAAVLMAATLTTTAFPAAVMADEAMAEEYSAAMDQAKEQFAAGYDALIAQIASLTIPTTDAEIGITLGEGGKALIGSLGMDLSWLQGAAIDASVVGEGGLFYVPMTVKLNDNDIVSLEACYNLPENLFYARSPELSEDWVSISIDQLVQMASQQAESTGVDADVSGLTNIGPMIMQICQMIPQIAPSGEEIFGILKDYGAVMLKHMELVPAEGTSTITAGGISADVQTAAFTMNSIGVIEAMKEAVPMIQADENIKNIITKISALTGDETMYDSLIGQVSEFAEQLTSEDMSALTGDEFSASMTVFVDAATEEAAGISYTINAEGQNIICDCYMPKNGDSQGFLMSLTAPDGQSLNIEGVGTITDGALTGDYTFYAAEQPVADIHVADLVFDEAAQTASGSITLKVSSAISSDEEAAENMLASLQGFGLTIDFNESQEAQDCAITITNSDVPLVTLSIREALSGEQLTIPTLDSLGTVYDVNDSEGLNNFTANLNVEAIMNNIMAAGVPEEFITQIMSSMTGADDAAVAEDDAFAEEAPAEEAPAEEAPVEEAPAEEEPAA